jgi:hypothetical protein
MRFDLPVEAASLDSAMMQVLGSKIGKISGTLSLSDDGQTVLFQPAKEFAEGEHVHVTLPGSIRSMEGVELDPAAWEFDFASGAKPKVGTSPLASLALEMTPASQSHADAPKSPLATGTGDLPSDFPSRTTGEIIWRLGGRNNQFTLLGDTLWFSHQLAIRRLPNGHYTLFDNGNGHAPQFSRAMELVLDTVGMTCPFVWKYARPGTFSQAMGYVQRLGDGNTFIGWGATAPAVSIVTPEGKTVYELWLPPSGLANRGRVIALNFSLHQNYPNPFNPTTTIEYEVPYTTRVTLTVYDALGQLITELAYRVVDDGMHFALFNGTGLSSGVYFCQLRAGSYAETRKLLIVH